MNKRPHGGGREGKAEKNGSNAAIIAFPTQSRNDNYAGVETARRCRRQL